MRTRLPLCGGLRTGKAVSFSGNWRRRRPENTLLNYRVVLNPDMDQLQTQVGSPPATVRSVAFGDFSKYVIRRAPLILQMLFERFATEGKQYVVLAFQRADGFIVGGGGAVKILTNTY